jgi:hypothetical protein
MPKPAPKAKQLPGFGDPIRDGQFEFVVSGIDCSKKTLGGEHLNTNAQGRFCVIDVSVRSRPRRWCTTGQLVGVS